MANKHVHTPCAGSGVAATEGGLRVVDPRTKATKTICQFCGQLTSIGKGSGKLRLHNGVTEESVLSTGESGESENTERELIHSFE